MARKSKTSRETMVARLVGSAVGFGLVILPEPATTLTGAGILAALWAPAVLAKK